MTTRRALIQQSTAAIAAGAAVIPSIVAKGTEFDQTLELIKAHRDAHQQWELALDTEGEFRAAFASQHRGALAAQQAERGKDQAWWDAEKERAKPIAEQLYRSIPDDGYHRSLVAEAMRDLSRQGLEERIKANTDAMPRYPHFDRSPEGEAYEDLTGEAADRTHDALLAVLTTPPKTLAGVAALLDYLDSDLNEGTVLTDTLECSGETADAAGKVLTLLANRIRELAA